MIRILLLLLIVAPNLWAYAPLDLCQNNFLSSCFPYVVFDDIGETTNALNGVAMIFNNSDIMDAFSLLIAAGAVYGIILRPILNHDINMNGNSLLAAMVRLTIACMIIASFTSAPLKTTMTIADGRSLVKSVNNAPNIQKVDNIPIVLALPLSITNSISYYMTKLIEVAFTPIDGVRLSDIGLLQQFVLADQNRAFTMSDLEDMNVKQFVSIYKDYIQDCILPLRARISELQNIINMGRGSIEYVSPAYIRTQVPASKQDVIDAYFQSYSSERTGMFCSALYKEVSNQAVDAFQTYAQKVNNMFGLKDADMVAQGMLDNYFAGTAKVIDNGKIQLNSYYQYRIRAELDRLNNNAVYSKALGMGGSGADALNYGVNRAFMELHNAVGQTHFIFNITNAPSIMSFLMLIVISAFPFVIVSALIGGWNRFAKVFGTYFGSMIAISLAMPAMAITQAFVSSRSAKDGLGHLLSINGDTIQNIQYYQWLAERAEQAASISSIVLIAFPMLVMYGAFRVSSAIFSGDRMVNVGGSIPAEIANKTKVEDAIQRDLVGGYASRDVMSGIEENNKAFYEELRTERASWAVQAMQAQWAKKANEEISYGQNLSSVEGMSNAISAGSFQGTSMASADKALGNAFNSDQSVYDKNGKELWSGSGADIARMQGDNQVAQSIESTRGLAASGAMSGGKQEDLYRTGLQNQARMSANQTEGMGKHGIATESEMNAIQYGSHAQMEAQIAEGKSLRETYGHNLQGTGGEYGNSYAQTAKAHSDMRNLYVKAEANPFLKIMNDRREKMNLEKSIANNKEADLANTIGSGEASEQALKEYGFSGLVRNRATNAGMRYMQDAGQAEVARENFKDVIGGNGQYEFGKITRNNASLRQAQEIGASQAWDRIVKDAKDAKDADVTANMAKMEESRITMPYLTMSRTADSLKHSFGDTADIITMSRVGLGVKDGIETIGMYGAMRQKGVFEKNASLTKDGASQLKDMALTSGDQMAGKILKFKESKYQAATSLANETLKRTGEKVDRNKLYSDFGFITASNEFSGLYKGRTFSLNAGEFGDKDGWNIQGKFTSGVSSSFNDQYTINMGVKTDGGSAVDTIYLSNKEEGGLEQRYYVMTRAGLNDVNYAINMVSSSGKAGKSIAKFTVDGIKSLKDKISE